MSEENQAQSTVETNNETNDNTKVATNDPSNIPESRFSEVVAQKNKYKDGMESLQKQIDSMNSKQDESRKKELEKQGEYKTLLDEANQKIEGLTKDSNQWTEYKANKRATIMEGLSDDKDKAIAEGLSLDKLELYAERIGSGSALPTSNARPTNDKSGTGEFGGYANATEWATKDPNGFTKHLENTVEGYIK
tara:strand:+ start:194 stop:769 length:576 start_codon:yes stop_codon:yes gene_type:complete